MFVFRNRERVDPDQLLLFEVGELETLLEEEHAQTVSKPRKRKRGGRVIPDGLAEETTDYEIPEEERPCPEQGTVMPRIRWEVSKQLDYHTYWIGVKALSRRYDISIGRHGQRENLNIDRSYTLRKAQDIKSSWYQQAPEPYEPGTAC